MAANMTINAFRKHCLRSLNGSISAASALCKRVGVQEDISTKLQSVQGDDYVQALLTSLSSVSLEDFDNAVRDSAPLSSYSRLRFDLTATALEALADEVITRSKQIEDSVANVPAGKHTFENTVLALANQEMLLAPIISSADFMQHVHANKEIRDASSSADKKITSYSVESGMRKDVFDSLLSYHDSVKANGISLDPESKRLLERYIRDFRRNGLELDEGTREKVQKIQKEIADLQIQFQRNLGEEDTKFTFTTEELEGMSQDFISKLTPVPDKPGTFYVSLKYPEYVPVMKICKVEETRRKLEFAFNSRCIKENSPILDRLCTLRHEKANLLGYPDHASYILDIRMAKSPAAVKEFLEKLNERLEPLAAKELAELLELKKKEKAERNEPFDGRINMWDFSYYLSQREKLKYDIDHEALKSYFPLPVVLKGMFDIYQQLLSLKFSEVPNAPAWHEDVQMYAVHDSKSSSLVGYFYLDLHPRDGKYGHAAVFGLQPQCGKSSESPQIPVAAMVANFSKSSASSPSLLRHQEVVTLFHEFGHVMHQLCSNVEYAKFSGTRVERDFVECPSQMLENWCWEAVPLAFLSSHIDDGSKIPDDLLKKLAASKTANAGLTEKRQILFGLFDQFIHSRPASDTQAVYAEFQEKIFGIPVTPGTNFAASFGHLAGGYDSQYYGYMWSSVYSCDMFASKFQEGRLLDPKAGDDYRKMILAAGGSRDAIDSVKEFLGREPNQTAFLKAKVVEMATAEDDIITSLLPLGFTESQIRAAWRLSGESGADATAEYLLNNPDDVIALAESNLNLAESSVNRNLINVECKLVLVVQSDLNMTPGKVASQCAHAALAAYRQAHSDVYLNMWLDQGEPIIVCKTSKGTSLHSLESDCIDAGIRCKIINDAGRTQVQSGSATVIAIGPAPSQEIDRITARLRLLA